MGVLGDALIMLGSKAVAGAMSETTKALVTPEAELIATEEFTEWERKGEDIIAGMGAVLGSPFGFLPFVGGKYSAGLGKLHEQYAAMTFRPSIHAPATIIELIRRQFVGEGRKEDLWEDLRRQGWAEERISEFQELVKTIPPLGDMVRFADFSAFDPEVIEKWREFYDAPDWIVDPMSLVGIYNEAPRDWANKYWFSHYVQPQRFDLAQMYRRGLLGKPLLGEIELGKVDKEGEAEETVKLAFRTMAFSEFWQDRLLDLVREIPTRVDVRRWWDMRTISEAELRDIYQRQGYFGFDLENYVTWTKVYTDFPDLVTRYKNGWITLDEVKSTLLADGMSEERATVLLETKIKKPYQAERVAKERDLTKSEIIKGVKKEVITIGQGMAWLMEMGYDSAEADFIVAINVAAAGSPETPLEYRLLVESYRRSQGMAAKEIPQEVIEAERVVKDLIVRIQKAIEAREPQTTIDYLTVNKTEAMVKLRELIVLHEL